MYFARIRPIPTSDGKVNVILIECHSSLGESARDAIVLHVAGARAAWLIKHADWPSCNVILLKCHLTCPSGRGISTVVSNSFECRLID